jgi:hypothetical protein
VRIYSSFEKFLYFIISLFHITKVFHLVVGFVRFVVAF